MQNEQLSGVRKGLGSSKQFTKGKHLSTQTLMAVYTCGKIPIVMLFVGKCIRAQETEGFKADTKRDQDLRVNKLNKQIISH